MIVVDEQLQDHEIVAALQNWYRGRVTAVTALRPGTVIKDEVVPQLLRRQRQPTFVTVNVSDFWRVARPDKRYCIVAIDLPGSRAREVPDTVRELFRVPAFATKAMRMSKIIRVRARAVEYYGQDEQAHSLIWSGFDHSGGASSAR